MYYTMTQELVCKEVKKVWELERRSQGLECPAPSIKEFVHVRIEVRGPMVDNPDFCPSIGRVRVKHRGILLTLKGTVIRSGATKMIEGERMYECRKCKHRFKVHPELESRNSIPKPTACPSEMLTTFVIHSQQKSKYCESTSFQLLEGNQVCHDYQEIKIQESTQVLGVGAIPRSIPVILQDDLVENEVIVTGVLSAKCPPDLKDVRCDLEPVLVANYVRFLHYNCLSNLGIFDPYTMPTYGGDNVTIQATSPNNPTEVIADPNTPTAQVQSLQRLATPPKMKLLT
ncbi:probable DNA helicase MCM9 [Tanacetum coccineum]